ncbi:MAG: hypothetical protein ACLFMQ_03195, partial [Desulfohalobiaceae bacterium]
MMEAKWLQPILDVNRNAFQVWHQSASQMQEQSEKMLNQIWDQAPMAPEGSKKVLNQWSELFKKEQEIMKNAVEQGFDAMERLVVGQEAKQEQKEDKTEKSKPAA